MSPPRSSSRARAAARARSSPTTTRSPRRWTSSRARRRSRRAPRKVGVGSGPCPLGGEAGARALSAATLEPVIDWKLAGTVARGVANMQPAGNPEPFEQLTEPAAEAERLVSEYTGLVPAQAV